MQRGLTPRLEFAAACFSGATASPHDREVWHDDAPDRVLLFDKPVVVHCDTGEAKIE